MADKAALFKCVVPSPTERFHIPPDAHAIFSYRFVTKNIGSKYGITPCFMAKPRQGLPGNSGHMHISLVDKKTGANLFARESEDKSAPYPDLRFVSDLGRQFLAGLLDGLADVMPIVAPTVNSYKRLVEK